MNTPPQAIYEQRQRLSIGSAYGITDIGTVRRSNEDNFLIDPAFDLAVVADGMGGHAFGGLASSEALLVLHQYLREARENHLHLRQLRADSSRTIDPDATTPDLGVLAVSVLFNAIVHTNQALYSQNVSHQRTEGGMGTTLTGFCRPFADGELVFFHIGDTRIYRVQSGCLEQLTQDQTLYQQALDAGISTDLPPHNILLQAVGPCAQVQPVVSLLALQPNDVLMLCSDGLHGVVSLQQIQDVLAATDDNGLQQSCHRLVDLAKANGSRDNITVVIVRG